MTGYVWGSAEADLEAVNQEIEALRKENRHLRLRNEYLAASVRWAERRADYYRGRCKGLAVETNGDEEDE